MFYGYNLQIQGKVLSGPVEPPMQKVKLAEKGMSTRFCVLKEGENLWLTALTEAMEKLTTAAGLNKCNNR